MTDEMKQAEKFKWESNEEFGGRENMIRSPHGVVIEYIQGKAIDYRAASEAEKYFYSQIKSLKELMRESYEPRTISAEWKKLLDDIKEMREKMQNLLTAERGVFLASSTPGSAKQFEDAIAEIQKSLEE